MATKAKPAKKSTTKKTVKKAHSTKSSKKLNKKGIGQHLLLIIVAVVAVTGATGFFVWQRQNNNNIDAKAAGLTYIAPNSSRDSAIAKKNLKMYACKNLAKYGGGNYVISFGGQKLNNDPKVYTIRKNGKIWQDVYFSTKNYAYPSGALTAYKTDSISMSWRFISNEYNYGSIQVSNIPNC